MQVVELIQVEQAFADDAQGKLQHLRMHLDNRAALPALRQGNRLVGDHVAIARDAAAQKRRVRQTALPQVQRLFTRQQAGAQHVARTLHHQVAVVVGRILAKEIP